MRSIIKITHLPSLFLFALLFFTCKNEAPKQPNILLIVADDLGYDSPGFAGGVAPDVTPNLDRLAEQSMVFENAFSVVSVCQPSRQSMLSGLIPHHYGSKGFFPMAEGVPTLPALLRENGYVTGNIHKWGHMRPIESFNWNFDNEQLGLHAPTTIVGRDPQAMAQGFQKLIDAADVSDQPFFMVINSADPHRPFHGDFVANGEYKPKEPSRIYTADEITVPPALPDIPEIRTDLAKYASSVRRLDDAVGACLSVLKESGRESSTLVIFVSDNGMPLPFGKFDAYLGSNRSPFLMRWPEGIQAPKVNNTHMVSLMDITPTVLELVGVPVPSPMDGKSLVPFIRQQDPESWRESIVFIRNEDIFYSGPIKKGLKKDPDFIDKIEALGWELRPDHPSKGTYARRKEIRTFFDGQYGYIYNNCYKEDGLQLGELGAIVPYDGASANAMKKMAAEDEAVQARYKHFLLRAQEELYDWSADPGSQHNLAEDPAYAQELQRCRAALLEWMNDEEDPLKEEFHFLIRSSK